MTNAWLAAGLGAVVVLDIALLWIVLGPTLARRLDERNAARRTGVADGGALDIRAIAALDPSSVLGDGVPPAAYDRVVRVASWAYLLSTAVVVYATGLWPDAEDPLLLVLAIGGIFILFAHDILPAAGLGPARFVVEGAVAITLVSIVIALTGGAASPFFYAYPLVVAGAALVVRPLVTVALAGAATAGYLVAVLVAADGTTPDTGSLATVAVNLTALALLAFVAMVVAREQRRTRDAAVRLSTIDAMTGLANRGYIIAALEREIDRATRYRRGFCVLMADLDGLKELNDTYGHRVGDRALSAVAGVIRENVRRIDTPARLGGDEFIVLLPETDREGARVVADKIRQGVAAAGLGERGDRIPLAVSIGLGEWTPGRSLDDVMAAADDAMYDVKRLVRRRPNGRTALEAIGPGRPPSAADRAAPPADPAAALAAPIATGRAQELRRRLTGPPGSDGGRSPARGVRSAAMDGFTTRAIRAATRAPRVDQRPTSVPIYQTATFSSADADELGAVTTGATEGYVYARLGNPTVDALADAAAELHGAEAGFAAATGMGGDPPRRRLPGRGGRPDRGHARHLRHHARAVHRGPGPLRRGDRLRGCGRPRRGRGGPRGRADPGPLPRDDLEPDDRGRGPPGARGARPPPRRGGRRRQHVRLAGALPAPGARGGPRRRIGDEVPLRPLGRAGRRGRGLAGEDRRGPRPARGDRAARWRPSRPSSSCAGSPRSPCGWSATRRRPPAWPRSWKPPRGSRASYYPMLPVAPPARRRGPPPRVRRRDARPRARRWRDGRPRLRRRPADPGADRVAGQHPHDRRAPAVDHPSPAGRGGARGGGDRPGPACACLGGPRGR